MQNITDLYFLMNRIVRECTVHTSHRIGLIDLYQEKTESFEVLVEKHPKMWNVYNAVLWDVKDVIDFLEEEAEELGVELTADDLYRWYNQENGMSEFAWSYDNKIIHLNLNELDSEEEIQKLKEVNLNSGFNIRYLDDSTMKKVRALQEA